MRFRGMLFVLCILTSMATSLSSRAQAQASPQTTAQAPRKDSGKMTSPRASANLAQLCRAPEVVKQLLRVYAGASREPCLRAEPAKR